MAIFIPFIVIVLAVIFFCHWFLYKTVLFFFHLGGTAAVGPVRILFGALIAFVLFAFVLASRLPFFGVRAFYTAAATWLGLMDFLFLASIALWVIYGASRVIPFPMNPKLLTTGFFGLAIVVGIYGIINAATPRVTSITVTLPNLPEYWQGKRAAWVSDLHLGRVRGYGFAKEVADTIQELRPHIVFIGGDLFDGGIIDLNEFTEPFSKLSAPDGIYFITGNHEGYGNTLRYLNAVREAGVKILDNELIDVKGLQVAGVDYRDSANRQRYAEIVGRIHLDKNLPSVLLKHSPRDLDIANNRGISLQISGHTHQGQMFPGNLLTARVYRGYDYGLKKFGNMQIYTSSGTGTWGPPMRVGSNPEIVVIRFEKD